MKSLSCTRLLVNPWTAAYQAPPSMVFSRQEYWSGVPLPSLRRTKPREYQIVRTCTKETTWIQDPASPSHGAPCRTPHLNNKQNKYTNSVISRQHYHLTHPCPSEEKQTNKKLSTKPNLHKAYTNHWTSLRGQKPKGIKNSTLKPGKRRPQTQYVKKKDKRQRDTTQMKGQTRNTEVQIHEQEIGKLPEKEFRMIVRWSKTLKTKWGKGRNQLTKT